MNFGNIMFMEMSQLQKNKLHYIPTVVKITEIKGRMAVTSDGIKRPTSLIVTVWSNIPLVSVINASESCT